MQLEHMGICPANMWGDMEVISTQMELLISHGLEKHDRERVHQKKGDKIQYKERRFQPRTRAEGECEISRDLATTTIVAT